MFAEKSEYYFLVTSSLPSEIFYSLSSILEISELKEDLEISNTYEYPLFMFWARGTKGPGNLIIDSPVDTSEDWSKIHFSKRKYFEPDEKLID